MSAPRTNVEKQVRRHIGPLIGMAAVTVLVVVMFVLWLGYEAAETDQPAGATDEVGAPAPDAAVTPDVIETAPQSGTSTSQSPIAPVPVPQGQSDEGQSSQQSPDQAKTGPVVPGQGDSGPPPQGATTTP